MLQKIKLAIIYEILGKPPEHIKEALEKYLEVIGNNKGLKIIKKKVHEPKPIEDKDSEGFFSTFAEVEIEVENLDLVFNVVTNTLPANIEIISPDEIRLKNFEVNSVLTELAAKLHRYDEVVKVISFENENLKKRLEFYEGNKVKVNENMVLSEVKEELKKEEKTDKKEKKKKKK